MRIIKYGVALTAASIIVCATSTARATPLYALTTLVTFNGANGANPQGSLMMDASGNLYGTTENGGANPGGVSGTGEGTLFEIEAGTNALTTLVSFNSSSGINPEGGPVADASGNLYGTAATGGPGSYGTVFELAAGTHTVSAIADFNNSNGNSPNDGLLSDASGNLYGTANGGGSGGRGTVFEVAARTHSLSILASFSGANGFGPIGGLLMDAGGNLYGTTSEGGQNSGGMVATGIVFRVAAGTHALSTIATFYGPNGWEPCSNLIEDAKGNLYGTTEGGGTTWGISSDGDGTIFEIAAGTNALTTLFSFNGTDGMSPNGGLIMDGHGNLNGTTLNGGAFGNGTVFELNSTTDALTTLFSFNRADGSMPGSLGSLTIGSNGDIFGTTFMGGSSQDGTVFELTPVPEPSSLALGLLALVGLAFFVRTKRHRSLDAMLWQNHLRRER